MKLKLTLTLLSLPLRFIASRDIPRPRIDAHRGAVYRGPAVVEVEVEVAHSAIFALTPVVLNCASNQRTQGRGTSRPYCIAICLAAQARGGHQQQQTLHHNQQERSWYVSSAIARCPNVRNHNSAERMQGRLNEDDSDGFQQALYDRCLRE